MTTEELLNTPLLPCPFCGEPAKHRTWVDPVKIGCFNADCPVKPKASSTDHHLAITKWNTRTAPSEADPRRAKS